MLDEMIEMIGRHVYSVTDVLERIGAITTNPIRTWAMKKKVKVYMLPRNYFKLSETILRTIFTTL